MTAARRALGGAVALISSLTLGGCPPPPSPGVDLYRRVANLVPGGALLGVWGDARARSIWVAGGYVGVDPARVTDGRVGRLVEYRNSAFTTRCTTDAALWWVHGVEGEVWAVGDNARVLRRRGGGCEVMQLGLTWSEGAPTFWGVRAYAADDVWIVGGSPRIDGPRAVLVHYDGARFERATGLPPEALTQNLYKIDGDRRAMVIAAGGGLILSGDGSRWGVSPHDPAATVRGYDNRLFTVSCEAFAGCWAVGGIASAVLLSQGPRGWMSRTELAADIQGLNGVWVQDRFNVFVVGNRGVTLHSNGASRYVPSHPITEATLHGVGGFEGLVMAVGGELSTADPSQRAVAVLRGDEQYDRFTFDGRVYPAEGELRRSIGGAGQ